MWGWKDPRTCLFLDFWEEIIPHANFLFVFRSPWQVVDSLLRRGHQDFDQRPELAFEVWFCYNSMIVDFIARNPQKCFLIDLSQVIESESYISSLNERFGLNLKPSSKKLFQDKLLKARMPSFYEAITLEHFPECFELHQRMLALASIKPNLSEPDRTLSKREAMQEWLKFRTIEKEKHEAEKLRNHYAEHLQVQREKCNALETHVSNLEKAREQLLQEKEFINHHLSALQKSRTWKLRSAIVKLKSFGRSLQSE
jgi:hypothetical protein